MRRKSNPRNPKASRPVAEHCRAGAVDTDLFGAVQAQLQENRAQARTRKRGARYLLQGLLVCKQCGHAYYGKPLSRSSAKGHVRHYAYYRCIGSDAYRFGGQRGNFPSDSAK